MDAPNEIIPPTPVPNDQSIQSLRREGVVFGRFGLRAGWGIAAYVAIWLVATGLASIFALGATGQMKRIMDAQVQSHAQPGATHSATKIDFTPLFVTVNDGVVLVVMLGAAWLFSRGERRPFRAYGLGRRRWMDFFPGAFWGLLLLSALVGALHALHLLSFDRRTLTLGPAMFFGVKWFIAFLLVGGSEEYLFRGYIQYTLMRGLWGMGEKISPENPRPYAFWFAATLLSLGFAALHLSNAGETHFGLLTVFLAGITFAYALWRTGSLWWAVGFHTTWDWAQSFLFGVPDSGNISVGRLFETHATGNPIFSGGSDGPEGSVFVIAALAIAVVILRFTQRGEQPALEQALMSEDLSHERGAAIS